MPLPYLRTFIFHFSFGRQNMDALSVTASFIVLTVSVGNCSANNRLGGLAAEAVPELLASMRRRSAKLNDGSGFLSMAWLMSATPDSMVPASTLLAGLLFFISFGQGLAMPTLMTMITGRMAPAASKPGQVSGA